MTLKAVFVLWDMKVVCDLKTTGLILMLFYVSYFILCTLLSFVS